MVPYGLWRGGESSRRGQQQSPLYGLQSPSVEQGDPGKWPARRDRTGSGSQQEQRIDVRDRSTKHADIILMPNASHIERRPEASEIWGEKIILQRVRIERLDLESAQGAEGP